MINSICISYPWRRCHDKFQPHSFSGNQIQQPFISLSCKETFFCFDIPLFCCFTFEIWVNASSAITQAAWHHSLLLSTTCVVLFLAPCLWQRLFSSTDGFNPKLNMLSTCMKHSFRNPHKCTIFQFFLGL